MGSPSGRRGGCSGAEAWPGLGRKASGSRVGWRCLRGVEYRNVVRGGVGRRSGLNARRSLIEDEGGDWGLRGAARIWEGVMMEVIGYEAAL